MIPKHIEHYAESVSTPESGLLRQIHRQTRLTTPYPNMLSGHLQGAFLGMVSTMLRPGRILEIGSFTGYSAICLAEGLTEGGLLHTIEINPEMEKMLKENIFKSGLQHRIILHMGDALDLIPSLDEIFDLVFIDADKENYSEYYQAVFPKVRPGGFIIADNVLWGGKVVEKNDKPDKETMGILRFNEMIREDERIVKLCLPVRDGLMIIRKL